MDLRDPIHTQLASHINTLNILSQLETPAALVWVEVQQYLRESACHIQDYILPKVDIKTPHVDLKGGSPLPRIAEFVGSTSDSDLMETYTNADLDKSTTPSFLAGGRKP